MSQTRIAQLLEVHEADFRQIKAKLADCGVNARGWRLYADFGDCIFEPLDEGWSWDDKPHEKRLACYASLLSLLASCEMDVLPPYRLLASLPHWGLAYTGLSVIPAGFFRALWKACDLVVYQAAGRPAADRALDAFVREELIPVARWYFRSNQHLDNSPGWRNASWTVIQNRHQQEKNKAAMAINAAREEWPSFVRLVESDGHLIQALSTEAELVEEGKVMRHCVGTYAQRCRNEMLRVYSIRDAQTGNRVATLSVKETSPGVWCMEQIKGPENAVISAQVENAASAVLHALEEAYTTLDPVRNAMKKARNFGLHQNNTLKYDEDFVFNL